MRTTPQRTSFRLWAPLGALVVALTTWHGSAAATTPGVTTPAAADFDGDARVGPIDGCPPPPKDFAGVLDHNGCPVEVEVVTAEVCEEIRIWQRVQFEPGSAELDEVARLELERVADELTRNPKIELVLVQGHTDEQEVGPREAFELSETRAEAIRDYLLSLGVPTGLLEIRGYGAERPVARNFEREGRAFNRRVTFEVIDPPGCT
jgi:OmpA-OmpF porin, OOP family